LHNFRGPHPPMTSSLITALTVTTSTLTVPATDGEQHGLPHALSKVPDPRDPRGILYPLSALLAVAVCALPAGASSFAAITDWPRDLDDHCACRKCHPRRSRRHGGTR
ncbi:transposase family protein, partial [Umezawaea endophytica]